MSTEETAVPQMQPGEVVDLVRAGEAILLDVREPGEWEAGHAPQADHMPMASVDLDAIPSGRAVVAVCRGGHRSQAVAEALRGQGIDARNLSGGMLAWREARQPVVQDDGAEGTVI